MALRLRDICGEQTIEIEHPARDLREARESERLTGIPLEARDRGAICLGLYFEVMQRRDDILGAVAVGDELHEALDPILGSLEALAPVGEILLDRLRPSAEPLRYFAPDVLDRFLAL